METILCIFVLFLEKSRNIIWHYPYCKLLSLAYFSSFFEELFRAWLWQNLNMRKLIFNTESDVFNECIWKMSNVFQNYCAIINTHWIQTSRWVHKVSVLKDQSPTSLLDVSYLLPIHSYFVVILNFYWSSTVRWLCVIKQYLSVMNNSILLRVVLFQCGDLQTKF